MVSKHEATSEPQPAHKVEEEVVAPMNEAPAAESSSETAEEAREKYAASVIRNNTYLSVATGVIPVPYVDTAALMVVNLKLLKELADVYNVEFRAEIGKEAIGVLLASVTPPLLAGGLLGSSVVSSVLRAVPVIGTAFGLVTLPALHGAFSYALGSVFRWHFANGGTFVNFDIEATKTYFRDRYDAFRARKVPEAEAVPVDAPAAA